MEYKFISMEILACQIKKYNEYTWQLMYNKGTILEKEVTYEEDKNNADTYDCYAHHNLPSSCGVPEDSSEKSDKKLYEGSEKQLLKYIENNTKKIIKKYPPKTKQVKMTIKLVKTEEGWKIDADSLKSLDPFVCDMLKGLLKAQKDFKK